MRPGKRSPPPPKRCGSIRSAPTSSACSPRTGGWPSCRRSIRAFNGLAARHRGETSAEVTSAHPLTDDQVAALKQNLKSRLGRDVAVDLNVDPAILGGLVVKVGSQMIDGSIRTKLNTLAHAMKG